MIKSWSDDAWDDFCYWQKQDKKTLKRILALIKDIDRIVYRISADTIYIAQCGSHYRDK